MYTSPIRLIAVDLDGTVLNDRKQLTPRTATRFGLGQPMTRAATAVAVCRLFGWEMVKPEKPSFRQSAASWQKIRRPSPCRWYAGKRYRLCSRNSPAGVGP